jgi:hypothetical protein
LFVEALVIKEVGYEVIELDYLSVAILARTLYGFAEHITPEIELL